MPGAGFKDHFSGHAGGYARARPVYPEALFDHLASLTPARDIAWDCGTGNGQSARALITRFQRVIGTDASVSQATYAGHIPGALFAAATAERAPLRDGSVNLITVAQALHWFDFAAFFAEARRVARPGGVLAVWCYGNCHVTPETDLVYAKLYETICGPYWPPERRHAENGYREFEFPFPEIPFPKMELAVEWTAEDFAAYLRTWSSVTRYTAARGTDPVVEFAPQLARLWGPGARRVSWPLGGRLGRVG